MRPGSAPPSSWAGGSQQPRTTSFSSRAGLSPGLEHAASSATNSQPTLLEADRSRSRASHVKMGRSAAFLVSACSLELHLMLPLMHGNCLCSLPGQRVDDINCRVPGGLSGLALHSLLQLYKMAACTGC